MRAPVLRVQYRLNGQRHIMDHNLPGEDTRCSRQVKYASMVRILMVGEERIELPTDPV
jgi:hypothetical protein